MKKTTTTRTVTVSVVAKPLGVERENGPHLGDIREFVAECDGLPDDVFVSVDEGTLNESGRRLVTITAKHTIEEDQA